TKSSKVGAALSAPLCPFPLPPCRRVGTAEHISPLPNPLGSSGVDELASLPLQFLPHTFDLQRDARHGSWNPLLPLSPPICKMAPLYRQEPHASRDFCLGHE